MKNKLIIKILAAALICLPCVAYLEESIETLFSSKVDELPGNPKVIVTNFLQALGNNNHKKLEQLLSKNYQVVNSGDIYDSNFIRFSEMSKNFKVRSSALHDAFPDFALQINELIAEDEKVVVHYTITGTQKGLFFGIHPTNKLIVMKVSATFNLKGGKIVSVSEMWNELSIMKQIGSIIL